MKDLVEKIDRLKGHFRAIAEQNDGNTERDLEAVEILVDVCGEFVANSRRIANALERIAENTQTVEISSELSEDFGPKITDFAFLAGQSFEAGRRAG